MGKDENWMMILTNSHHHHYGGKMLVSFANTGNDDFERTIMLLVVVVIIIMMKATFDEVFKAKGMAECKEGASKEQEEREGPATPHVTAYLKISRRCHLGMNIAPMFNHSF